MSVTKQDIINRVAESTGLSKADSRAAFESTIRTMKESLGKGEDVLISKFGKFEVREKSARPGRNPGTGQTLIITSRRVVTFKSSGGLKKQINDESEG